MKHINRIFLVAAAILAPLAARADLVFVAYRMPTPDEIWSNGLDLFRVLGLPILVGGGALTWIYRRARHREPLAGTVVFRRWLIWFLAVFVLAMTISALVPRPEFMGCGGHKRNIAEPVGVDEGLQGCRADETAHLIRNERE